MCFYGQQPWLDVVRVLCSPFHGNWLQRPWIAWSSVSAVLRHHLAHFGTIPQHTGLPSFLPRSVGISWCFMFGLPSIVSFCPCLTKLSLHLYHKQPGLARVSTLVYKLNANAGNKNSVCVCVCVCLPSIEGRVFSPHNSIILISPLKKKTPDFFHAFGNREPIYKQDQTGSNRIDMEWHGYGSTQINKASPHLCVPGSRCNVIAIAVALAASWAISWEPLTFWGNLWSESKFHDILQWMNKHQCLRSPVLSILFCVCFFACLWFASFGATLLLVCFCVFERKHLTKSKRVKTWNFVQTLIKQSNSNGNLPTALVLLPPWCRCHLWNDGCCLNTRRSIILYHRLLACPRSNHWCLNCNLRKCEGKKTKKMLICFIFIHLSTKPLLNSDMFESPRAPFLLSFCGH